MQDKAIAQIGHWQLEKNKYLEPVDLYIENMFPGKDYQMLLLVFEIIGNSELACEYKGIDIEKVGKDSDSYRKFAYRKGTSGRAGDVTISTKISDTKKLNNIKDIQFPKLYEKNDCKDEALIFKIIHEEYKTKYKTIENEIKEIINNTPKEEKNTIGITLAIDKKSKRYYLNDFIIVRQIINDTYLKSKISQDNDISKTFLKRCSITNKEEAEIFGFAAPFKYSSPDKPGFISGFFNKKKFWRNYPVSSKEALALEYGRKFIKHNLTGYFYGHEYLFVPHPVINTDQQDLEKIISLLTAALIEEDHARQSKEKKKRAEDRVQKLIALEDNYFYLDMLFYKEDRKTEAISINMMLEEILPSRFRKLFIEVPSIISKNNLFKGAITIKKEIQDLEFSFRIVKSFFDDKFLEMVYRIFLGKPISEKFVFERIMKLIRKNYNQSKTEDKWTEPGNWTVKKAIMLLLYLEELQIIKNNQNYQYMDIEVIEKKERSFRLDDFNSFIRENKAFLDSDIKVGIFAIGILVRYLFDIQKASLGSTPFENKLRGYKLNPQLLLQIYTEALDKIQRYQKNFYVYAELREIVNSYFILRKHELKTLDNNELSFYFVAGLELGKRFKNKQSE